MPPRATSPGPGRPADPAGADVVFPTRADPEFWRWLIPGAVVSIGALAAGVSRPGSVSDVPAPLGVAVVLVLVVVAPLALVLHRRSRRPPDLLVDGALVVGGRDARTVPLAAVRHVRLARGPWGVALEATGEDDEVHEIPVAVERDDDEVDSLDAPALRALAAALRAADVDRTVPDAYWEHPDAGPVDDSGVRGGPRGDLLQVAKALLAQADHLDRPGRRPETGPLLRPAADEEAAALSPAPEALTSARAPRPPTTDGAPGPQSSDRSEQRRS